MGPLNILDDITGLVFKFLQMDFQIYLATLGLNFKHTPNLCCCMSSLVECM